MADSFFSLKEPFVEVDEGGFLALLMSKTTDCRDLLYRPETLKSIFQPWRYRVNGVTFTNVSFRQTTISDFDFTNCTFEECLFISTIFRNCRFTSCSFVRCNPHRIEFHECFVDPLSFCQCIAKREYANIGVYLFQELLRNSRQQAQPNFADEAQYQFSRWNRFKLERDLASMHQWRERWSARSRSLALFAFEIGAGYGMRLRRLTLSSFVLLLFISTINWVLADQFGLQQIDKPVHDFVQAIYFSTVVMTTVGFGDITPTTTAGRLVVSVEAITGFVLLALLTSTLYRRFSS
jgi:hypothetical protein